MLLRERALLRWLVTMSTLLSCATSALATHTALAYTQARGLIPGDYADHPHGTVVPVLFGATLAGTAALLLYVLHLFGVRPEALPALARKSASRFGWQSAVVSAVGSTVLLVGMETVEQLGAGHFDGVTSAFSSVPLLGLVLIALFSAAVTGALRACCKWIAAAHAHVVLSLAVVLPNRDAFGCVVRRSRPAFAGAYAFAASRIYGRRGPPNPR